MSEQLLEYVVRIVAAGERGEDRACVVDLGEATLVALADGAGGMGGGAAAAERAVSRVCAAAATFDLGDPSAWCALLAEIDAELDEDHAAGETTLVALVLRPEGSGWALAGASVGDSGARLWCGDEDDLTEGQYRKPLLGSGGALPVGFERRFSRGKLLVASDGLLKYARPEAIRQAVEGPDLESAAQKLVEAVRLPSGALWDDVAIVLCRFS